ncbi:sugar transporter [Clostridium sp. MT-14]|uniref:sugar transporter n=1 Tax=Clostridium sp. MT-14 TaxID=3348360 RepID=UPI00123AB7F5|nr:sugar transporter [Clostridium sp. HV4-5-A1G]KAA8675894.1 sugar transporter [Clostridium sp. HV4-5-A1G]CAB1254210.1 D-proline reductase, 45 kDa subunit [Clostridiaceae bacterium BL-3]
MSMSAEHAEEVKDEVAVVCCRTEEGTIIAAENLEDPDIFPDMVDSGLLTIPDNCLKVKEVIGAKLTKTIDSLTPLTPDILEGIKTAESKKEDKEEVKEDSTEDKVPQIDNMVNEGNASVSVVGGTLKIQIEEGRGIDIELPFYIG